MPAGPRLVGVEAVIDKDLASALLARDLGADVLAIVTDVDAVYTGWGTPQQRAIRRASPEALAATEFAAGSMGPKVRAACSFVEQTGGLAAIGSIEDTAALVRGEAGTVVADAAGLELGGSALMAMTPESDARASSSSPSPWARSTTGARSIGGGSRQGRKRRGARPRRRQRRRAGCRSTAPNQIRARSRRRVWQVALPQLRDPMNIMLVAVAVVSFAIGEVPTGDHRRGC